MNLMIVIFSAMLKVLPGDFTINYNFVSGTIGPPNSYKYSVTIDAKGKGVITFTPNQVFDTVWTEKFNVPKKEIKKFAKQLKTSGFYENSWAKKDKYPVGGSVEYLEITANGKKYTIPTFPVDKGNAETVLKSVKTFIPQKLLDSLIAKKDKAIEEYKNKNN